MPQQRDAPQRHALQRDALQRDALQRDGAPWDAAQLVRTARQAARLSQAQLAVRAEVSRGSVAGIETGARSPSWTMLTALLAAAGQQLRVELEPLDEDLRRAVVATAGDTAAANDLSMTLSLMEGIVDVEYRVEGLAAAAVLGAPIALREPVDLALPDTPEAVGWLVHLAGTGIARLIPQGWSYELEGIRDAAGVARLVESGEGGLFTMEVWLRTFLVRFVPAEQARRCVVVAAEHAPVRAQPLHEIDATDRETARVLRLLREQAQDP